ncbi:FecR domain-containing protein, partial [Flavobacterium sp.]|uniref:FecR domain-containing protein n=1 Tax=Flavobacterium sp. TaxID=239 RepID=UPI003C5C928B
MENKKINKEEWRALVWLNELFRRYYENQATEKEKQIVENWNPEQDSKPDIRFLTKDKETEIIWERIAAELGFISTKASRTVFPFATVWRKYAAVAIVFLALGTSFYLANTTNTPITTESKEIVMDYFQSGAGERKKMNLPDGSVVYLNSDTKIAIASKDFNKEKREIWLEEGEAFF